MLSEKVNVLDTVDSEDSYTVTLTVLVSQNLLGISNI